MFKRPTSLAGVFVIEVEPEIDERGYFRRLYERDTFEEWGLETSYEQCSMSYNEERGTLRGLHFQIAPHEEVKVVWCARGAIFDVVVDLRPDSVTYRNWWSTNLGEARAATLYVPKGVAHGFQTLAPNTLVHYQISTPYDPSSATGIRWDDVDLAIPWPMRPPKQISQRDRLLPTLADGASRSPS